MQHTDFINTFSRIGAEKGYGHGEGHMKGVLRYSLMIYAGLVKEGLIGEDSRDIELLEAASYVHDVGVTVIDGELGVKILPEDDHCIKGFKWLFPRLEMEDSRDLLTPAEKTILRYLVLWHNGDGWLIRPEEGIDWQSMLKARVLAGVLRVGDGFSSALKEKAKTILFSISGTALNVEVVPHVQGDILNSDFNKTNEKKKDVLVAALKAMSFKKIDDVQLKVRES
jgi:hypothetical protein